MVIEFSCKSKVTIKGGLLQMEPALIFSDPQKSFIGQQYYIIVMKRHKKSATVVTLRRIVLKTLQYSS